MLRDDAGAGAWCGSCVHSEHEVSIHLVKSAAMGILTERPRPLRSLSLGDSHNMVIRLLLANLVVFAALVFVKVVYTLTGQGSELFFRQIIPWAVLPDDPAQLLSRPWTVFTYMFVHINFWHILGTCVWLWWFGSMLQDLSGYQRLLPVYVYGGLCGALFFYVAWLLFPGLHGPGNGSLDIGASASVMAVVVAVTVLAPNYRVFPMLGGGIPLYLVTIIYVVLSLLAHGGDLATGYTAAIAGGALMGAVYAVELKKGHDWGGGLNRLLYWATHLLEPADTPGALPAKKKKRLFQHGPAPYKKIGPVPPNKVDEILDKINRTGYASLNAEEKELLVRAARDQDT